MIHCFSGALDYLSKKTQVPLSRSEKTYHEITKLSHSLRCWIVTDCAHLSACAQRGSNYRKWTDRFSFHQCKLVKP